LPAMAAFPCGACRSSQKSPRERAPGGSGALARCRQGDRSRQGTGFDSSSRLTQQSPPRPKPITGAATLILGLRKTATRRRSRRRHLDGERSDHCQETWRGAGGVGA
jgi:hypothetical protein